MSSVATNPVIKDPYLTNIQPCPLVGRSFGGIYFTILYNSYPAIHCKIPEVHRFPIEIRLRLIENPEARVVI